MADFQKKKRKAMSIQDTANLPPITDDMLNSKGRRSGYSGPKKSSAATVSVSNRPSRTDSLARPIREGAKSRQGGGYAVPAHMGGILEYAWIAFIVILSICLLITLIVAGRGLSKSKGYYIPRGMFTSYGILNTIYEDYQSGKLAVLKGDKGDKGDNSEAVAADAPESISDSAEDAGVDNAGDTGTVQGTIGNTAPSGTMTGATMALDDGTAYGSYPVVTTYEELLAQISQALEANDFGYIGRKLSYTEENTGQLSGFPQSVIEYFTYYMSLNADKRATFVNNISSEDFKGDYNGAMVVKLPLLKFTVNMGYDNTKLSITGFADQTLNAGQSATVAPLLPCMYTITVTTPGGTQSSNVEANMNEGNLQINIGVTDKGAN